MLYSFFILAAPFCTALLVQCPMLWAKSLRANTFGFLSYFSGSHLSDSMFSPSRKHFCSETLSAFDWFFFKSAIYFGVEDFLSVLFMHWRQKYTSFMNGHVCLSRLSRRQKSLSGDIYFQIFFAGNRKKSSNSVSGKSLPEFATDNSDTIEFLLWIASNPHFSPIWFFHWHSLRKIASSVKFSTVNLNWRGALKHINFFQYFSSHCMSHNFT